MSKFTFSDVMIVLAFLEHGRGLWPSGQRRRVMIKRSRVKIPAPDTRWTFSHWIVVKNCFACLKRLKINNKRGRGCLFKNIVLSLHFIKEKRTLGNFELPKIGTLLQMCCTIILIELKSQLIDLTWI